ncbi:MAG: DUF1659 domain-containing protein [Acetobacterium sp.]|jgi:hypothetical protein|uniref:DUF1659 domain-containing protein n=1 Tax=Acetobacterium sp. TaxID=1872094 RepID=UPI003241E918
MAVSTDFLDTKIQIRSNHGMVDGKEKTTSRTYGDVRASATDQDIYDVAVIIAGLQQPVMEECIKQEINLIMPV